MTTYCDRKISSPAGDVACYARFLCKAPASGLHIEHKLIYFWVVRTSQDEVGSRLGDVQARKALLHYHLHTRLSSHPDSTSSYSVDAESQAPKTFVSVMIAFAFCHHKHHSV